MYGLQNWKEELECYLQPEKIQEKATEGLEKWKNLLSPASVRKVCYICERLKAGGHSENQTAKVWTGTSCCRVKSIHYSVNETGIE